MTNLSLDKLREVTGAFISESAFQVIELEYLDVLKESNLTDSEDTAQQFYELWKEEQESLGTFIWTKDKKIKYYCMDGSDDVQLTTDEFLDNLDMTSYHWENMCRSYWKIFKEILDTGKVNTQLLKNILSEATISHEQIYELLKAIKGRCKELVE